MMTGAPRVTFLHNFMCENAKGNAQNMTSFTELCDN